MKWRLIILMMVSAYTHAQQMNSGVHFTRDLSWKQVQAKAKSENKYIFMDVFATWCGPCKHMDSEVYVNDTIGQFTEKHFISVKVQMDSTGQDNAETRKWYRDVAIIGKKYQIAGYPSFLFFSPDGNLIYQDIGFKEVPEFLATLQKAIDPQTLTYFLMLDDFRKGKKNVDQLYPLAKYAYTLGDQKTAKQIAEDYIAKTDRKILIDQEKILFVQDVAGDSKLADSLAAEYKKTWLEHLNQDQLSSKENIDFIGNFSNLINTRDSFFYLFYFNPEKVDKIYDGYSQQMVNYVVTKEELKPRTAGGMANDWKEADWDSLTALIHRKYIRLNAEKMVMDYRLQYYKNSKQWVNYVPALISRVQKFGAYGMIESSDFTAFNLNSGAWDIFVHSSDKAQLEEALAWSNAAIRRETETGNIPYWMYTKANVMYKLGMTDSAIALENKIIVLDPKTEDFRISLDKMKKGEPTWTVFAEQQAQ